MSADTVLRLSLVIPAGTNPANVDLLLGKLMDAISESDVFSKSTRLEALRMFRLEQHRLSGRAAAATR